MRQVHGVLGLLVAVAAIFIGVIAILRFSVLLAVIYVVLAAFLSVVLVYSFCSKCPCRRHNCGHVFPGKLAAFLPQRKEGPYSALDYIGVIIPLLVLVLLPQYWLWQGGGWYLLSFWVVLLAASAYIFLTVCKGCGNEFCPVRKNAQ